MCAVLRMGRSGSLFALPRSTYPSSPTLSLLPLPLSLVQGLEYLELGPAAGAAELVDCAINFVVVTRVREAAAAEAAGSGRASEPCLLHFVRSGTAQGTEQAGLAITIHM